MIGIIGGVSLVQTAKARALLSEVRNYQQAVYSFETIMGRLPGDLKDNGEMGRFSGNSCSAGDLSAPYDGSNATYGIPKEISAPFVELFLQKIIHFQPKHTSDSYLEKTPENAVAEDEMVPYSQIFTGVFVYFESAFNFAENLDFSRPTTITSTYFKYNLPAANFVSFRNNISSSLPPKILKYVDNKIDDGAYNTGNTRGYCDCVNSAGTCDYDFSFDNNKGCNYFLNKI